MKLLIHTYGRVNKQVTYRSLPPSIQKDIVFVVQEREASLYPDHYNLLVLPPEIECLRDTRQWLVENLLETKMCILDDDLTFAIRRLDEPSKFRECEDVELEYLFGMMEHMLDLYPLVGISAREGANYITDPALYAVRQMRIHAIDLEFFRKHNIRFRPKVMEDFDITLQVLRLGKKNYVINDFVTNQAGSNATGGCSHYRTDEVQRESAEELARLHPGFVTVIKKKTKRSWGGKERYDVRVQWKQAYKSARTVRLLGERAGGSTEEEGSGSTETVE